VYSGQAVTLCRLGLICSAKPLMRYYMQTPLLE
jgi:hypothetical protein